MTHKKHEKYGAGPQEAHPIQWSKLVPSEQQLLGRIHAHLRAICSTPRPQKVPSDSPAEPWAEIEEDPRGRVMVINGARGSGKTTLLVTLLDQLNRTRGPDAQASIKEGAASGVRPLGILDFDPLPKGVPLHAWLIQAWLPLVRYLEAGAARSHSNQVQCAPLREAWDNLFKQAVTAWTDVDDGRSMVDRLFDQSDQLRNYQDLAKTWRSFVADVFELLGKVDSEAEVILISIDDVDLQVKANVELIHAMRLLRHPRVIYLVTADLRHAEEVVSLDFLGQHDALRGQARLKPSDEEKLRRRCQDLSTAILEKAYPAAYIFATEPVSITDLLNWKGHTLCTILDNLKIGSAEGKDGVGVGTWLANRADGPTGSNESFMHWRGVQRIRDEVDNSTPVEQQAALVLRHILAQGDAKDHVSIISRKGHGAMVDFRLAGDLLVTAVPAWFTGSRNNRIVVGTELTNVFKSANEEVRDVPTALLAREMHEATEDPDTGAPKNGNGRRGPVQADSVILTITTVLVWTRWTNAPRNAIFLWPFARFPRIPTLREWLRDWDRFTSAIRDSQGPDEKLAYAWILCQLKWGKLAAPEPPKWESPLADDKWDTLFDSVVQGTEEGGDFRNWFKDSFPLLALPEFGLPERVQQRVLNLLRVKVLDTLSPEGAWDWFLRFDTHLRDGKPRRGERHQCAMDALYVAWEESGSGKEPDDEEGDKLIKEAEKLYPEAPWIQLREELILRGAGP